MIKSFSLLKQNKGEDWLALLYKSVSDLREVCECESAFCGIFGKFFFCRKDFFCLIDMEDFSDRNVPLTALIFDSCYIIICVVHDMVEVSEAEVLAIDGIESYCLKSFCDSFR